MKIFCEGKARIRDCATGEIHEIESDELDWEAVGGDERGMGVETHYQAVVDHPVLGGLSWELWEYPVGVENYKTTDARVHEVVEDFIFGLEHAPESDEWLDYAAPDDPFSIFMDSYHHTGDLLADHGQDRGGFLLNRMIFSHQITALEAYLGDTLINAVMSDTGAIQRLIERNDDLMKERFSLVEISKEPALVERKVREYLRSILYHNLSKVDVLYDIALGIRILNESKDKASMFKAVTLRHDCVHRNGFNKDGEQLDVFTKQFVQETADLIRDFVVSIEKAVRNRSK